MSDINKKLESLLYELHGYDKGEVEILDAQISETVKQIKQLFKDAGYRNLGEHTVYECHVDPRFWKDYMTGQEWYDRFEKELPRDINIAAQANDGDYQYLMRHLVLKVAKKASGLA